MPLSPGKLVIFCSRLCCLHQDSAVIFSHLYQWLVSDFFVMQYKSVISFPFRENVQQFIAVQKEK